MSIFERARELAVVQSAAEVIAWDQETYMPSQANDHRAKQLSWLAARAHEMATCDEWRQDLEDAENSDMGSDAKLTANLRELRRHFERATKLPTALVARESSATSLAKHAWAEAREKSDFNAFAPHLEELLEIAREKAAQQQSINLPAGPYPVAAQQKLNQQIAESIGFDFTAGRIDTTAHPFCTTLGPHDVRLTTRYDENDFTSSLFGVLHEAGHGLYEQGLPANDFGLPSGAAVSLGIHESQSRLWENHVGRSREFWQKWYPVAQEIFPQLNAF
ncbi:MAG: carboxypeptidase M32, partial [Verrucomicrobia bacterium]|nr:carboxypeptidase M32 [Verrucomicrobiota bacterium]